MKYTTLTFIVLKFFFKKTYKNANKQTHKQNRAKSLCLVSTDLDRVIFCGNEINKKTNYSDFILLNILQSSTPLLFPRKCCLDLVNLQFV